MRPLYVLCSLVMMCCWAAFLPSSFAQLQITNANTLPFTPENLITNVFLGEGVEVLSVTYNGVPAAVGYFTNATGVLGIERGIVMSTGNATGALGPNNSPGASTPGGGGNGSTATDVDLDAIASNPLNDVAVYEIVFKPFADTIRFNYVFASEEYMEFACSDYNDIFGFFLSGPGITGPFSGNGRNLAIVPGTANTPVAIANVHGAFTDCPPVNGQYYNNNPAGNPSLQYDGYTDIFTATAVVIPCETYRIRLAISDVQDDILDTGVFLEAKSFGTPSLKVEAATASLDGTITEGCAQGLLSFRVASATPTPRVINYGVLGTAQNGVDYQTIPTSLTIPTGDSIVSIPIIGFEDGIGEPIESIGIDVQRDPCNRDTIWIYIRDNAILPPNLPLANNLCAGENVVLDATLPIPLPMPPTFQDTVDRPIITIGQNAPVGTMPTESSINVFGVQPPTLGAGVIQSVCVNIRHNWIDDIDMYLVTPGGQFLELATDIGSSGDNMYNTCFTPTATTPIGYILPPATGAPYTGDFLPEGNWADLWDGNNPTNGVWKLIVIDDSNGFSGTLLDWTLTFNPIYQLTYAWTPSGGLSCADCATPTAMPTASTEYQVVVTDSYGCTVSDTTQLNVQAVLSAPIVVCNQIATSAITFGWDAISGAVGYEVRVNGGAWQPATGSLEHQVTGLSLNQTVNIEVRGIGNCGGAIGSAVCETPSCTPPTVSVQSITPTTCPTATDGSIELSGISTNPPLVYTLGVLSNQTGVFNNLADGVYTITYIDGLNCEGTLQVSVTAPPAFALSDTVVTAIDCASAASGAAAFVITGGTAPYSFAWSNGQTDSVATNLQANTNYTLQLTDANGCMTSASLTLSAPTAVAVSVTQDSVDCQGSSTGSAQVTVSGGTAPYSYLWNDAAAQTTDIAGNLSAGVYQVTVTDANGCTASQSVSVLSPTALQISLSRINPLCAESTDGQVTAMVTGGTPPYLYFWENGESAATALQAGAGMFAVTVADVYNCVIQDSILLTAPPALQSNITPTDALCFGAQNGSAQLSASGGTAPLQYQWSNGTTQQNLSNVIAGTYFATITDANGCTLLDTTVINQPSQILTTLVRNDSVSCAGASDGSLEISATGGQSPYTYAWSGAGGYAGNAAIATNLIAGSYQVIVTDNNNCTTTFQTTIGSPTALQLTNGMPTNIACKGNNSGAISYTTQGGTLPYAYAWAGPNGYTATTEDVNNLLAGLYTLTVTDANGCTYSESLTLTEPALGINATLTATDTVCFAASNGIVSANVGGGTGPYTYTWSTGSTTSTLTNIGAGTYQVTITDNQQCTFTASATIATQAAINVLLTQTSATCHDGNDGQAQLSSVQYGNANAPLTAFLYRWNTTPPQSTATATQLIGGNTYTLTVTDSRGCTGSNAITIANPEANVARIDDVVNVTCFGGSDGALTVTPLGGTAPYTFVWNNGQTNNTAINLPKGNYRVTVTDANNCSVATAGDISEPPILVADFETTDVLCTGGNEGSATALVAGGIAPYRYQWSNGSITEKANNLAAGNYIVTITDNAGCTKTIDLDVEEPATLPDANLSVIPISCYGANDGRVTLVPQGGTPPYTFAKADSGFGGNNTFFNIDTFSTVYALRDAHGCTTYDTLQLDEPLPILVDIGNDTLINYGEQLTLTATVEQAIAPVSYQWAGLQPTTLSCELCTSPQVNPTSGTHYTVTITDANGCTASDIIRVVVEKSNRIFVPTGFTPNGDGNNDVMPVIGVADATIENFSVYNRWGGLVYQAQNFESNDLSKGWNGDFNGNPLPTDTYLWWVKVRYQDGFTETLKGETMLVR